LMLRNLLDEYLVVKQVDLLAFGFSRGHAEPVAHHGLAPRNFAVIAKRRLLRCAKRTSPQGTTSSMANQTPTPAI
jgi:hypothetical protein